ncbi:ribosomal protein S18 acetylase RimI-like enzyme [Isoptericola jiangsuensis]|uniref:Ribosomal protein S18 acetylase RimI-like enzyme n=1 Tax=Isoptericola jiangsuensis TaxID=548579 RepID=A0A2A9EWL9_9MICO|nr:GNAT family N-acetyltransferase [Isoptericola jiangsuensis]PFG42976.1 ribosomal protein S18 acetylase RimI-like enzyme [Isoptericola jiangsuensis]
MTAIPSPVAREEVRVRPRRPADVAPLGEVLAAQQPASGYPHRWPLPYPVAEFVVRADEEAAWVAEVAGRPVGHVSVTTVRDDRHGAIWSAGSGRPVAELGCVSVLFVAPDVQGRGVGGLLLDTAVAHLRSTGRTPVLDVDRHDGVAHAVYLHKGWRVVGEARFEWQHPGAPPARMLVLP